MTVEQEYVEITEPGDGCVKELITKEDFMAYQEECHPAIELSIQEAAIITGYMDGHDYVLGVKDGMLLRGDKAQEDGAIYWEEYSMDDAIDTVCEWNYELIMDADAKRRNPNDFVDFADSQSWYDGLKAEEIVLDRLFEKTKYHTQIEVLAEELANQFIANLNLTDKKEMPSEETMNQAAYAIAEQVRSYGSGGRGR